MIKSGNNLFENYENEITCIYGDPSTGKTTLVKLAAIEQAKQGKKVVYLDTENGFNLERIKQLAGKDLEEVLKNILIFRINSFSEQNQTIKKLSEIKNITLLIIDTIGRHYRTDVKNKPQIYNALMGKQFEVLSEMSRKIPVIITNQVYTNLDDGKINMVGGKMFRNWSKKLIRLDLKPRKLIFEKPSGKEIEFEICSDGIRTSDKLTMKKLT